MPTRVRHLLTFALSIAIAALTVAQSPARSASAATLKVQAFSKGLPRGKWVENLTVDAGGNLWFSTDGHWKHGSGGNDGLAEIGRVSPAGTTRMFSLWFSKSRARTSRVDGMALGPDGKVYFWGPKGFGRIGTDGSVENLSAGLPQGFQSLDLVGSANGKLVLFVDWKQAGGAAGQGFLFIDASGAIDTVVATSSIGQPSYPWPWWVIDDVGNMWYPQPITVHGNSSDFQLTQLARSTSSGDAQVVGSVDDLMRTRYVNKPVLASDGRFWFSAADQYYGYRLLIVDPATSSVVVARYVSDYVGHPVTDPQAAGPGGSVWVTYGTRKQLLSAAADGSTQTLVDEPLQGSRPGGKKVRRTSSGSEYEFRRVSRVDGAGSEWVLVQRVKYLGSAGRRCSTIKNDLRVISGNGQVFEAKLPRSLSGRMPSPSAWLQDGSTHGDGSLSPSASVWFASDQGDQICRNGRKDGTSGPNWKPVIYHATIG